MGAVDIKKYELFERYDSGEMNPEEESELIKRIKADDSWAVEYEQYQKDRLAIKELVKDQLKAKAKALLSQKKNLEVTIDG